MKCGILQNCNEFKEKIKENIADIEQIRQDIESFVADELEHEEGGILDELRIRGILVQFEEIIAKMKETSINLDYDD